MSPTDRGLMPPLHSPQTHPILPPPRNYCLFSPRDRSVPEALTSSQSHSSSGAFTSVTKLQTKKLGCDKCWACNTLQPEICHVTARKDPQVRAIHFSFENGLTSLRRSIYRKRRAYSISHTITVTTPFPSPPVIVNSTLHSIPARSFFLPICSYLCNSN